MKRVLLTAFAALTVFAASAQIEQGTWLIGGSSNLGFTSFNEDAGDYSQFNIDVKGGYFVIENLAVGLNLGYSSVDLGDFGKETDTGFGVFTRYYFNGKIFGGVGFNSVTAKFESDLGDSESTISVIPIEVGYAAFIGKVVAIEPALNYSIYGGDGEGASFGVNIGISVYLGRGE